MRILLYIAAVNYQLLTEKIMVLYASSDVQLTDEHNSSIVSSVHDVSTNIPSEYVFLNHTVPVVNDRNFSIQEEMKSKITYYNDVEFRIWQIMAPMLLGKWNVCACSLLT